MNSDTLKISLIESIIYDGNKDKNLNCFIDIINNIGDSSDVVIFPELFTTGFIPNLDYAKMYAEDDLGKSIQIIKAESIKYKCTICGSYLARVEDKLYNRAFCIEPNGNLTTYDKYHLFSIGGEKAIFEKGSNVSPIIKFNGWNLRLGICYDIRFPVFCRNIKNEYDILIFVANWPKVRYDAWLSLLKARAIENCCYVCGVNRRGVDENGLDYGGGTSIIVDYKGKIIAETTEDSPIASAVLSKEMLTNFRVKFPVWKDADEFIIK